MLTSIAIALISTSGALAWGSLGHEAIAYIAQDHVSSATEAWAQDILDDTSSSYLASIATWADTYRYTTAGEFSAPYHYIDAEDDPPDDCNVDYDRDCGDSGCSVSAIANYTQRVQEPDSLSAEQVNYALRFLVHFIGDITQPLHDEELEVGGNDIDVTFDGEDTNLHHIWDTNMPEELVGGYALSDARDWATTLSAEIDSGDYASQADDWVSDLDIDDAVSTALGWASDANAYVCSVVIPDGQSAVESGDLYPDYYDSAIATIELQVAKAGYRLAKWLDAIAATQTSKKRKERRAGAAGVEEEKEKVKRVGAVDLSGRDLLPPSRPMSKAKLRRAAMGYNCGAHKH
ncbi:Nuclease S1 [Salinomyces thailandicus]|uniref:Nuclease S1 n=1 Tax=Salinomyces thailandicus TaxID=706561 RepID=A0A4U0U1N7_9PEZI|nr:Nuclease S1 [Salinomyces thailandica]